MRLPTRPGGFAIVSAIFILVVLAVLGAAIVNVTSSQAIGSAQDVQGVRAYAAARSGIEWGLYKVQSTAAYNFGYTSANANLRACPTSPTSFVPAASTLTGFTVTVTCELVAGTSGGPNVYQLTATACSQPNAAEPKCPNTTTPGNQYIERRLSASI